MTQKLNPELLLIGARLAQLDYHWEINNGAIIHGDIIMGQWKKLGDFNPIESNDDAWALERALKDGGWSFGPSSFPNNGKYRATHSTAWPTQWSESDTLLLLKCLSAQTGVSVYE